MRPMRCSIRRPCRGQAGRSYRRHRRADAIPSSSSRACGCTTASLSYRRRSSTKPASPVSIRRWRIAASASLAFDEATSPRCATARAVSGSCVRPHNVPPCIPLVLNGGEPRPTCRRRAGSALAEAALARPASEKARRCKPVDLTHPRRCSPPSRPIAGEGGRRFARKPRSPPGCPPTHPIPAANVSAHAG
jgi:hypothetical protein